MNDSSNKNYNNLRIHDPHLSITYISTVWRDTHPFIAYRNTFAAVLHSKFTWQ